MGTPMDCFTVIAGMTSGTESTRKLAAYHLQSLVSDPSFADTFVQADGMRVLRATVLEESGNALAYALGSLTRLLETDVGWESVGTDIIERVCKNKPPPCTASCAAKEKQKTRSKYSPHSQTCIST